MTKSDQAPGFQIPEQTIFHTLWPCEPIWNYFFGSLKTREKNFLISLITGKKNIQDVQLVLKACWNGACVLLQQAMMITEHVGHHL